MSRSKLGSSYLKPKGTSLALEQQAEEDSRYQLIHFRKHNVKITVIKLIIHCSVWYALVMY